MNLNIAVEGAEAVQKALRDLGPNAKQAERLWINWTGLAMQGAMRDALPQRFQMRGTGEQFKKAIVFRQILDSSLDARKVRQSAELVIGDSGVGGTKASATKKLGVILARHEEESTRTSSAVFRAGKTSFAGGFFIPDASIRSATKNPPKALYPVNIGAQIRIDPGGKLFFAKSKREATKRKSGASFYVIPNVGIFQRDVSLSGSSNSRPLWWFSRSVHTPARLGLFDTAQRVFDDKCEALGMQAIEEALFRASLLGGSK